MPGTIGQAGWLAMAVPLWPALAWRGRRKKQKAVKRVEGANRQRKTS